MSKPGREIHIFVADDDDDDCLLFKDVLGEIETPTKLTCVANGNELMKLLNTNSGPGSLPDILFLDLNMPIKNGIECLTEIKESEQLSNIPVIIFSTSAQEEAVNNAYKNGADLYLRKPDTFLKLKEALKKILLINWKHRFAHPSREDFLIDF